MKMTDTEEFTIYATNDALGGRIINGPTRICAYQSERGAARHIASNPDHHAIAPNGDVLCWDGEAVVREPAPTSMGPIGTGI